MLSTRQLEVIHAVMKAGSVTDAAAALGVSQPAVSMILRECNEIAGFPLFVRRQGRLQPTAETYVLLPELERVFDCIRRVHRVLGDLKSANAGFVNVGSLPLITDSVMPLLLSTIHAFHDQIQVNLHDLSFDDVIEHVETDKVDFGLTLSPYQSQTSHIVDLFRTRMVFVCHAEHPLAAKASIGPDDLIDSQLITFNRSVPVGAVIENAFRQTSVPRRAAVEVTHTSTACMLARHQVGVALIPELGLRYVNLDSLVHRPFVPATSIIVQLWLPQHKTPSRSAKLMVSALRKIAASFEPV